MSEPEKPETVVVIDDDYTMRLSCGKILAKMGMPAETFEDGSRGLAAVAAAKPAMVIVDLKMPGISGMEVISRVHEIDPQIVIVVITGYATIDTAVQAVKCGAYDFLPKPFSPDELRLMVNRGLERRRLALEAERHEAEQTLLKRRFVTFVSHQLRTPLVAIHQYLDVLKSLDEKADDPARRKEWLERCLARIEELQDLIADWLTLARVEGDSDQREGQSGSQPDDSRGSQDLPGNGAGREGDARIQAAGRWSVRGRRHELPERSVQQSDYERHQVQHSGREGDGLGIAVAGRSCHRGRRHRNRHTGKEPAVPVR